MSHNTRASKAEAKQQQQRHALHRAITQESFANYPAIFEGFAAKGIAANDVRPRENVFTFDAWRALGRTVRKGEKGVTICTVKECRKKNEDGSETTYTRPWRSTVFHISQTDPLNPTH